MSNAFFRFLMCLGETYVFPAGVSCVSVGGLSSDVTTSVCSSILSYLRTHSIRLFETVSGPLLEEVTESIGHFTALADLTEEMLWDDVGVSLMKNTVSHCTLRSDLQLLESAQLALRFRIDFLFIILIF